MRVQIIAAFLFCCALETAATRLPCLKYTRRLRSKRNPKHAQVTRCCGDSPYSSKTHTCCHDETVAELCRVWSPWQPWSACSATCGAAERFRNRVCRKGKGCPLDGVQVQQCGEAECQKEFIECQSCSPSASNDDCNNQNETCEVLNGEGCQNIVRRENSKTFVEKRCKQLQACHTEARLQVLQGVCDPLNDISLCLYCCEGTDCNKNLDWQQPSWYRQSWGLWLERLALYSQLMQNAKVPERKAQTFESFLAKNLTRVDDTPLENASKAVKEYEGGLSEEELDAIFVGAILEVDRMNLSGGKANFLLAKLNNRLPGDFPRPKLMRGFAWMR